MNQGHSLHPGSFMNSRRRGSQVSPQSESMGWQWLGSFGWSGVNLWGGSWPWGTTLLAPQWRPRLGSDR